LAGNTKILRKRVVIVAPARVSSSLIYECMAEISGF